jgi:hypothetical protein
VFARSRARGLRVSASFARLPRIGASPRTRPRCSSAAKRSSSSSRTEPEVCEAFGLAGPRPLARRWMFSFARGLASSATPNQRAFLRSFAMVFASVEAQRRGRVGGWCQPNQELQPAESPGFGAAASSRVQRSLVGEAATAADRAVARLLATSVRMIRRPLRGWPCPWRSCQCRRGRLVIRIVRMPLG